MILISSTSCTTSKWTVVDEHGVDDTETPEIVSKTELLHIEERPTVGRPVLKLAPYQKIQMEYPRRVKVQRTVQEYQPKWSFAILSLAGSSLALFAANTDRLVPSASLTQRVALNLAGVALGTLAFTNLKERGEPILTEEVRYLRQSGIDIRTDTMRVELNENSTASLTITYNQHEIFNDSSIPVTDNSIEINLGALTEELGQTVSDTSKILVTSEFKGNSSRDSIAVTEFMEPYFQLTEPVVAVRNSPSISDDNIITELGEGSSLLKLGEESEQWIQVEYGSIEAYVQRSSGFIEWKSTAEGGPALLVELSDIPFGQIDVENSLPVLKNRNPDDRAVVLSVNRQNQAGSRQFAGRDERLFRHYMTSSLQMDENQVTSIDDTDLSEWTSQFDFCEEMNGGIMAVYLTGFATTADVDEQEELVLYHQDENGNEQYLSMITLFEKLSHCSAEKLFVFVDLEYTDVEEAGRLVNIRNSTRGRQQGLANVLLSDFPNAFVVFGNRTDQPSSVYSGTVEEDKRHHIFPYFLAQALKQRKTQMSELFRHLENNVDYTSRRLHDRSQEVQAFGNFMLNIAE